MINNDAALQKRLNDAWLTVDFSKSEYAYRLRRKDTGAVQARLLVPHPNGSVSDDELARWVDSALRSYEREQRLAANREQHAAIWLRLVEASLHGGASNPTTLADTILLGYQDRFEK